MGPLVIKNIVFATFLALIKIPLGIVGTTLIARNWTTADEWSGIVVNLALLGACFVWAKIETTEIVRKMSGVVAVADADRIARVARSSSEDRPLESIKQEAQELKSLKEN